jgi:Domain of unknown function (DUF4170)
MGLNIQDQIMSDDTLYHLVFGGRVKDPTGLEFEDLKAIDFVGIFPNYTSAEKAWRGAAQRTVDDAQMKYVVVHLHRLMEPHDDDHA